ncbi:MAG: hypothetical protein HYU36_15765 [Planctomycetes bacterium]|nr:hypothetical protein [Planctomycetota bacterium]
MRTAGRVAIPALLLSTLAGCTIPGLYDSSHENDGGHKGQVVDGITGKGLTGAWLTGALPTYRDRIIKTRGEGLFCYHNQGNPGGVTFHCKGYISRTVSMDLFYRATISGNSF